MDLSLQLLSFGCGNRDSHAHPRALDREFGFVLQEFDTRKRLALRILARLDTEAYLGHGFLDDGKRV